MKIWRLTNPWDDRYAHASCVGSWSDGAFCPECTASSERRIQPLVFEWEPGSDAIGDFTVGGLGDDIAITKPVADALINFGGFELGAIEMFQRRGLKPPKNPARVRKPRVWLPYQGPPLHALWVTKHVPLNFERSSVQVIRKCTTCGEKQFEIEGTEEFSLEINEEVTAVAEIHTQRVPGKGFYVDERHLADAAIFRLRDLDAMVLCTDTVKRFIEAQGFTNIAFLECGETFQASSEDSGQRTDKAKPADALTVADLQAHPVWQFTGSDEPDETYVRPLKRVPVANLAGKLIGTEVVLANGRRVWALIGNVEPSKPRMTEHFLTLSIALDGHWFQLARYHDVDAASRGPKALAAFLKLPIDDVFPISYDIRRFGKGDPAALSGRIPKKPRERLSRKKIISLIFENKE